MATCDLVVQLEASLQRLKDIVLVLENVARLRPGGRGPGAKNVIVCPGLDHLHLLKGLGFRV